MDGGAGRVAGVRDRADLLPCFTPETELEEALTKDPELLEGLAWGEPRSGHPEGTVIAELGKGFRIHDRVLRPTKVAVSVKPAG